MLISVSSSYFWRVLVPIPFLALVLVNFAYMYYFQNRLFMKSVHLLVLVSGVARFSFAGDSLNVWRSVMKSITCKALKLKRNVDIEIPWVVTLTQVKL